MNFSRGYGLVCIAGAIVTSLSGSSHAALPKALNVQALKGTHVSACTPQIIDGVRLYSVLSFAFQPARLRGAASRFASIETVYQDPNCEISVFKTNVQGRFGVPRVGVLTLVPSRVKLTVLSSRMAESMDADRSCGKAWIYGEGQEILGTSCHAQSQAQYFLANSRTGIDFLECEGQTRPSSRCTRYKSRRVR